MEKFKKILKDVGLFLKKVGLFIWKYLKICWNYIKENAWIQPLAIVALIFGLVFSFQGIVDWIDQIQETKETAKNEKKNKYTTLTMKEVEEKLSSSDNDFILFIGSHKCSYCVSFTKVINKYIESTGQKVYYVDLENTVSFDVDLYIKWADRLGKIDTRAEVVEEDGGFNGKSIGTPTVVVIRDGEFADAKSGTQGLSGGMEYLNFVKFVEGEYIGKYES